MKNIEIKTPSEYYRMRRPEYFSDSKVTFEILLTKEVLAYELEKITTNQKHDLFEGFCRRLIEKVIAPNLIPQTGPTGGGDGKTDAETYPVSIDISDRWFIPENGWDKDEKWAFAISAKKMWKPKLESDIVNILSTNREYTRVYFISNQTISSKQRKETQDKYLIKHNVDIVILDGVWILEEVFKNNFIDITVDSLNLSSIYKSSKIVHGSNDIERENLIKELEEKIQNPNRYAEYDFQKVEDALEAAVIARKLERPRDEVEGKFDRAVRFSRKLNLNRHWVRIHYQKAWTYLYYYDDYSSFIQEYNSFKKYISINSSSDELELYLNLFNSLRGLCASNCQLEDHQIDLDQEKKELFLILDKVSKDSSRPFTSLKAEIDLSIQVLMDSLSEKKDPNPLIKSIYLNLSKTVGMIEFPFESYHQIFEELGDVFANNSEYDKLIDLIASIAEKRSSELTSGKIFLQRGGQKYSKNYFKESIIFFGKALLKLAKEETEYELCLTLLSLGHAFSKLGLYWASNNCFISANFIAFKPWYQQGKIVKRAFECSKQLAINELLLGRVSSFLTWHELLQVISNQIEIGDSKEGIDTFNMLDAFLSVRLANIDTKEKSLSLLPDVLEQYDLWLSQNAILFKLGYSEEVLQDYKQLNINTESELHRHFEMVANQPFRDQMILETNFNTGSQLELKSKILGCSFRFQMQRDVELILAAETFAAFFENFLSTSISGLLPNSEEILVQLIKNEDVTLFDFIASDSGSEYTIEINKFSFPKGNFSELWNKMIEFISHVISNNFYSKDLIGHLGNLFEQEELHERLAFVYEHRDFTKSVLGDNPKLFFEDWAKGKKEFLLKGDSLVKLNIEKSNPINLKTSGNSFAQSRHDENKIVSIIQIKLWDQAKWKGFGPFYAPGIGTGVFLAFENGIAGKAIFDGWLNRFGKEDKDDFIKITLIKGVNKGNPFWYKVHITANIQPHSLDVKERFLSVSSRFHQMTPTNPNNLNKIEQIIASGIKFILCPAEITNNGKDIDPYFDKSIVINSIDIKNAWELGINDSASVVLSGDDDPIIPSGIENAPVLEILKNRHKK